MWNISATSGRIFLKFQTLTWVTKLMCTEAWNKDNLKRKTTLKWNSSSTKPIWSAQRVRIKVPSNGRWPHQIKNVISQQPLIGSFPNFIVKLSETICSEMNTISYKRRHQNIEIRTAKQVIVGDLAEIKD